jgi:hypothetical protein
MQVWRLLYTNLVGPRGEKLEWEVHMSFPREHAFVGDALREVPVVWILFTYGGCNKGGSFVFKYLL